MSKLADAPCRVGLSWENGRMVLCMECIVCDMNDEYETTLSAERLDFDRTCDCCEELINPFLATAHAVDKHAEIEWNDFDERNDNSNSDIRAAIEAVVRMRRGHLRCQEGDFIDDLVEAVGRVLVDEDAEPEAES